jgi:lipopolysaccharide/colanic/teichoic acid biosynthesis glycosyltransferase
MDTQFTPPAPGSQIGERRFCRCFDVVASALGLLLLSPLLFVLALAIKLSDGGPVLFRQRRIGRGFCPFSVCKFRTMVPGADRLGAGITAARDPRVTGLGRVLRRYKLDELPQLWNVLRGDMALVGPRPEVPEFVESFRATYGPLLTVRPGITDPATLVFSNEEDLLSGPRSLEVYAEQILPRKLSLSLEYFQARTWRSDVGVVLRTLAKVFLSQKPRIAPLGPPLLARGAEESAPRRQP